MSGGLLGNDCRAVQSTSGGEVAFFLPPWLKEIMAV